jgi:dethiobiotin synthetase
VAALADCAESEILKSGVRLRRPVSPHLAARLSAVAIDLGPLEDMFNTAAQAAHLVVEGAGGALVPLNDLQLMTDLMSRLDLPVIIVARSTLGTINHTLLTIEALQRRSLYVAGVVMVGPPNSDNRAAIEQFGSVPVLGEMPMFDWLTPKHLASWSATELDPDHHLQAMLR